MDITPLGIVRNLIPKLPYLVKNTILSFVGWSDNSEYQDVLTELIVNASRPILGTPAPLLKSQLDWRYDYGVWGQMWVSRYTVPKPPCIPPEKDLDADLAPFGHKEAMGLREAVELAIHRLDTNEQNPRRISCPISDLVDVEVEWTGYRSNAWPISPRPNISEQEMYNKLTAEADPTGPTILYFHGGAHCLMDPSTHRLITSRLAKNSRGRVMSVRFRLSPQDPFPAPLLDALQCYLALISPPPGAFHEPVPPQRIVLAGDSSGGGLAASLLLLLQTLSEHKIQVSWHNDQAIQTPSPPCAGLALTSPYLDISRCLPSTRLNTRWDIIAPPPFDTASPPFPPDEIWPTSPPRVETYVTAAELVSHPLVNPLAAPQSLWDSSKLPSIYVNVGWEAVLDEVLVCTRRIFLAQSKQQQNRLRKDSEGESVTMTHLEDSNGDDEISSSNMKSVVIFDGYEGMPHCFSAMPWNEVGRRAASNWGKFCWDVVQLRNQQQQQQQSGSSATEAASPQAVNLRSKATWTNGKTGETRHIALEELGLHTGKDCGNGYTREEALTDQVVERHLQRSKEWRVELEKEMVRQWKDDQAQNRLG